MPLERVTYQVGSKFGPRPKPKRCSECGASPNPILKHGRPAACYDAHPDADLIDFPRELEIATKYVVEQSQHGTDLERWVEECDLSLYAGVGRGDLAIALVYARKWQPYGWNDSDLPVVPGPVTLYGKLVKKHG